MKKTISIVLVLALCMVTEVANADFVFGTPTNLGPNINTQVEEGGPCISADGLSLYFYDFLEEFGKGTLRMTTRETIEAPWGQAVSLELPINSGTAPCISADGLSLYFDSGGLGTGGSDIWVVTRRTVFDPWGDPVNLGPSVNSSALEMGASISADGLELYFGSNRSGGSGDWDLWVTKRVAISNQWSTAINLGPTINSVDFDGHPCISPDGLTLFITSTRPGGQGDLDIWMTRRATRNDDWSAPVNLGSNFNTSAGEAEPSLSTDGRTLYFSDWWIPHTSGFGAQDLWQISVKPIVDLNSDGVVDSADMCIVVDNWGTDNQLCDIGPMPWGDGIVDVQDLIVLAEHLFEDYLAMPHWKLDEEAGNTAHDSLGVHDGTLHGEPLWQPNGGMIDGALELDGIDDYISTDFILDPSLGAFSIFGWVKGGAPGQVIISQLTANGNVWLGMDASAGNLMTGLVPPSSGWVAKKPLVSKSTITSGQWYHIGFVWDGSYRILYMDGIEIAKDTTAQNPLKPADGGLHIGAGKSLATSTFFSGMIDDIRIYDVALTAEEIAAMAQ